MSGIGSSCNDLLLCLLQDSALGWQTQLFHVGATVPAVNGHWLAGWGVGGTFTQVWGATPVRPALPLLLDEAGECLRRMRMEELP